MSGSWTLGAMLRGVAGAALAAGIVRGWWVMHLRGCEAAWLDQVLAAWGPMAMVGWFAWSSRMDPDMRERASG
ncbi:MAG: hypothetical protein KatS3mg108_1982 [Isosphaeraceae bacterium]|jgi:hypothetical protein|nr:MAG: hypothetical protein KatS3mg108_1982 [Isosphaeraceae bacterium]